MRTITRIIVHCSASAFGDASLIDQWHKDRGWSGIGYHYVILNGFRKHGVRRKTQDDGLVEVGRPVEIAGAHCKGHNHDSIGICLIGDYCFTARQLYKALPGLLHELMGKYDLWPENIHCHYEYNAGKTCPNIPLELILEQV